ncbi:MAG: hypothetical protein HYV32_02780 [Candidatus Kerfeldbacteria bacterium]|nr:hypothetical protein [Candidatus Kerfeldbacteria bacterium]
MKNFNRASSGSGNTKKNFNRFAKKDSRKQPFDHQLYEATCESCGKTCGVPFKPNGKKPVYCSLCFKKGKREELQSAYGKNTFQKPSLSTSDSYKTAFDELNRKLDKILKMLAEK